MATDKPSAAAVRIELANDDGTIVPPPAEPAGRGSNAKAIGALAIGILIVSVMVWATRPDDGQTAAGTPITVPTTVPDEIDTPSEEVGSEEDDVTPSTTTSEDDVANAVDETDTYESAAVHAFISSIVEADVGWMAFGFGNNTITASLFRSVDGLNWTPIPEGVLPAGDLLGLDRFDDTYVVAVDEAQSWSETGFDFEDGVYPDHRIRVWTSTDTETWEPSDLPGLDGNGFPYSVSFTPDSYVVSLLDAPDNPDEVLIDFLAPFVDAETAIRVCSSQRLFETASRTVELTDCEGGFVAEVVEDEYPDDFENVWLTWCIDNARSVGRQRFSSVFTRRQGEPSRIELAGVAGRFALATSTGVLSRTQAGAQLGLPVECGGAGDGSEVVSGLTFWSQATGSVDVTPTSPGAADEAQGLGPSVSRGEDDRYYVSVGGSVLAGTAPFDSWEEVLAPPIDGLVAGTTVPSSRLTLSSDGRHAFVDLRGMLYLAPLGGDWIEVPVNEPLGFTRIVVATNEYVVVIDQGRPGGQRLVKIPLP